MKSNSNNIKEQNKENEDTILSSFPTRKLQTLSSIQGFLSKSELQTAVDEYCRDPNGWVNNTKYATYGYVISITQT